MGGYRGAEALDTDAMPLSDIRTASHPARPKLSRKATELLQRNPDRVVQRCVRLLAKKSDQAAVVHAQRLTPQVAHLCYLAEHGDKRRRQCDSRPWEAPS